MVACRVLPHLVAAGAEQMAIDHALLDSVDANPSHAIVRTYEWREPTLSLGYFQSIAEVRSELRWQTLPVVRRPSGGGALLHDMELTYALVVPRTHSLARRPTALYRAVHSSIAARMRTLGIPAERRGDVKSTAISRPFLCFLDRDSEDVLVNRTKVVGSAQRRRPAAVLQHGSILIAQSAHAPELPGLSDLGIEMLCIEQWAQLVRAAACDALQGTMTDDVISDVERRAAITLEHEVYKSHLWIERR